MAVHTNKRFALEMSDFPSDRAVALCIGAVTVGVLIFTGAGEVMWHGLADTVAAWWLL